MRASVAYKKTARAEYGPLAMHNSDNNLSCALLCTEQRQLSCPPSSVLLFLLQLPGAAKFGKTGFLEIRPECPFAGVNNVQFH